MNRPHTQQPRRSPPVHHPYSSSDCPQPHFDPRSASDRRSQRAFADGGHNTDGNLNETLHFDPRRASDGRRQRGHDTDGTLGQRDNPYFSTNRPRSRLDPLDVDYRLDAENEDNLPQGGQIISPRHWDRRQLAQSAGHSPLDAAALGCREYHGYQRGYYPLTAAIVHRCGFRDASGNVSPFCNDIILLHRRVLEAWENRRTQQHGPSVDRILEKGLPVFPKLDTLDVASTVTFYDKLQKTSALFLLPLMLFDAINLNTGFEGLCPPGLGLPRYAEIAGVLMEILPRLLPESDSQVASLVTVVRAESNNGFDLLWRILELAVPGFDPSLQISAPVWLDDDIFDFCLSFVLYFRLQAKKGLIHDERTKSITFLRAVRDPAYADVITTLQAHIDTFLSKHDFGYLPPNLCMMGLAGQMNKNAQARARDVLPRMARRLHWYQDDWTTPTPDIQGYSPQVYRTDTPRDQRQYDDRIIGPRTPDPRMSGRNYGNGSNYGNGTPRANDRRPGNDRGPGGGRPGGNGGKGRYARPDHNRRPYDPNITCAACKRRGHPASTCDMLAMALFLNKYNKSMTKADRDKVETAWLQRWKEKLGDPSRLPSKVMKAYIDYMDISEDVLDHQIDWECWPEEDTLEEFDLNVGSSHTTDL